MSKRDKAAAARPETPQPGTGRRPAAAMDLDDLQGPVFLVSALAGFMYLIRLAGVFGHPAEHIVGVLCWAVMLACTGVRLVWEQQHGNYPTRWGGVFVLVIALLLGLGLLVEITVATNPVHTENQPYSVMQQ